MEENIFFLIGILVFAAILGVGILDVWNPEILWNIFEKWKSNGAKTSSYDYDSAARVGGVITIAVCVYVIISIICTWCFGWDFPLGADIFGW